MKYKQKYLNTLYKEPVTNFKEIIDISIYFDDINELDYVYEAISAIEKLEPITILNLLLDDLINRNKKDFDNYGYQAIWWALLNSDNDIIYKKIANSMTDKLKLLFDYWISEVLEPDDEPYIAINKIILLHIDKI